MSAAGSRSTTYRMTSKTKTVATVDPTYDCQKMYLKYVCISVDDVTVIHRNLPVHATLRSYRYCDQPTSHTYCRPERDVDVRVIIRTRAILVV